MSGLIPIKLAEQAMANLEAELTDLKSTTDRFEVENSILMKETARLYTEVERLDNLVRYWSEKYQTANASFLRASERIAAKDGKQS